MDLHDKRETATEMYRLVENYHNDLSNIAVVYGSKKEMFSNLTLEDAFDVIKMIPYQQDRSPVEVLSRPEYIGQSGTGADCKKKSVLMASYLRQNGIPYRFVAVSTIPSKKIHHVFTQALINGNWENLDPTYSDAKPYQIKHVTNYEVL